ncbi:MULTISPECIES: TolB family protein [unclassified Caulobacter]|uniref:TolB family protein n=1 Tax=unclassified Caulobacter TaxID=2648921 RepID=UPI001304FBC5|nr:MULTISPECIES: PD40 domain-containing protein [unclassified Caulobacter]
MDWTPDGSALLYAADTAGDERQGYYLLSPDGARERVLLPKAEAYRQFGVFSADGKRFVYSSTERNGRDYDVYVGDVATRGHPARASGILWRLCRRLAAGGRAGGAQRDPG